MIVACGFGLWVVVTNCCGWWVVVGKPCRTITYYMWIRLIQTENLFKIQTHSNSFQLINSTHVVYFMEIRNAHFTQIKPLQRTSTSCPAIAPTVTAVIDLLRRNVVVLLGPRPLHLSNMWDLPRRNSVLVLNRLRQRMPI